MPEINISGKGAGPKDRIELSAREMAQREYGLRMMLRQHNIREEQRREDEYLRFLRTRLQEESRINKSLQAIAKQREKEEAQAIKLAEKQRTQKAREEERVERTRLRMIEKSARDEAKARQIFWRDLSIGGIVGSIAGQRGGFTGLAKEVGGLGAGAVAGALGAGRFSAGLIAEIVAEVIGIAMNPLHAAMAAAQPAIDFQLSAFRLGRLSGFGGRRMEKLFAPNFGTGLPDWMLKLGVSPQMAVSMGQQLGVPMQGDPGQMIRMLRILELQPSLQNLPPGATTGLMSQAMGMGLVPPTAGGVTAVSSNMMRAFIDAQAQGYDASKIAGSMESSLDIIARSTVPMSTSITGLTRLLSSGMAGGTPQGVTGALAAQTVAGMSTNFANSMRNPMLVTAEMGLFGQFNRFKTRQDVERFLGPNATAAAARSPMFQYQIDQAIKAANAGFPAQAFNLLLPLLNADPNRAMSLFQPFASQVTGGMSFFLPEALTQITGAPIGATRQFAGGMTGDFRGYNAGPKYEPAVWAAYQKRFHQTGPGAESFDPNVDYFSILTKAGVPASIAASMVKYGKQYGVNPMITAAVADVESSMRPNIGMVTGRNQSGKATFDFGLMQINSANWKQFGGGPGSTTDQNIRAGTAILSRSIMSGGGGIDMNPQAAPRNTMEAMAQAGLADLRESYASLNSLVPSLKDFSQATDRFARAVDTFGRMVGFNTTPTGPKPWDMSHWLDFMQDFGSKTAPHKNVAHTVP